MEVYKHKSPIVLSYTQLGNKKYIEVFFGTDEKLRFLLSREPEILFFDGKAFLPSKSFVLSDFYDRYSPHAYIDYSRVYVRHPKPKREYTLPEGYLELLEQKRYSPSTIKTYRAYFSDFMEYHKGRNIDRLKVADINKYILYLVNEKKISVSQQNMRINSIKFYYEQVKGGQRQYYGGIIRAKAPLHDFIDILSRITQERAAEPHSKRHHKRKDACAYYGQRTEMPVFATVGKTAEGSEGIFQGVPSEEMVVRGR